MSETSQPSALIPLSPDALHDELVSARALLKDQRVALSAEGLRAALLLPEATYLAEIDGAAKLLDKHIERLNAGLPAIDGPQNEETEEALFAIFTELAGEVALAGAKVENVARLLNGEQGVSATVPNADPASDLPLRRAIVALLLASSKMESIARLLTGEGM